MKYNLMWSNLSLCLVICLLCATAGFGQQILDKTVAKVGGEIILLSDIEEQYRYQQAVAGNTQIDRCDVLNKLIAEKLLVYRARIDSVVVTEEEVETQLNARIEQILSEMNYDQEFFEEYYGQSVQEVKKQFRKDLRNQLLAQRMQSQIMASVEASPAEVVAFYHSIPKDSLPYFPSEVEIAEIVIKPEVNPEERERAFSSAMEIREKLMEGEDFSLLAETYSDDLGSARRGGDLGWQSRGSFVEEFEGAVYNMEVGEISSVVESPFGYHIIKLIERRGNRIHAKHILITPEIVQKDLNRARNKLDSVRTLILNDSIGFNEAVRLYSHEEVMSYHNGGRLTNPANRTTFFEISDLDPDIYFAIDTIEVGEITSPIAYKDERGNVLYRIVLLQSRTAPHSASLKTDYAKIQLAATEQKKTEKFQKWVDEQLRKTFVYIDPLFDHCENYSQLTSRTTLPE